MDEFYQFKEGEETKEQLPFRKTKKQKQNFGLQRYLILGDRNCLFRSISQALYGDQEECLSLQSAV